MLKNKQGKGFYGITTVGEKGQAVIPASARKALSLKKGDKLLVFGRGQLLAFSKLSDLEHIAHALAERLDSYRLL
ncbi:MAG TPA: AbrB/MazE/SpoVT family DNA-binding domain-containing protein [Patescibacteria group bacterium]|nr:AbrB/MazE/SpoVT family DNA-binding domain-containing protein [Patescibacteria group bacterium]